MKSIPLTNGGEALVDARDFDRFLTVEFEDGQTFTGRVCDLKWKRIDKSHTSYAVARKWIDGKQREIRLHRLVRQARASELIDHRNHNGLDCQQENLRYTDTYGNARNRLPTKRARGAKLKGVALHRQTGRFEAYIKVNGKKRHLGLFPTEEEAGAAYNAAAKEAFGEFACLNAS